VKDEYMADYKSFFIDGLVPVLAESGIDIKHNFVDTTPSNGFISTYPNAYVKRSDNLHPQNVNWGDAHLFYMDEDCENDWNLPFTRFMSESGFPSESSYQDYAKVSKKSDLEINSDFIRLRTTMSEPHERFVKQSA